MSYVNFGDHQAREWAVIKLPDSLGKAWVENGIGVEGDSGAWIRHMGSNQLYEMNWGVMVKVLRCDLPYAHGGDC